MESMLANETYKESGNECEMLPWFVNGTLNEHEVLAMERHLQHCDDCAQELPVLRSLRTTLSQETVAVLAPSPDTEQFLAQLDQGEHGHFNKSTWLIGAVAAAVALLAVAFFSSRAPTDPAIYQTVVEADSTATFDYVLQLSLHPQIDAAEHNTILQSLQPVSIADLGTAGDYRVVVRLQVQSVDELERYRQRVESKPAISSASVIAIELPIEAQ